MGEADFRTQFGELTRALPHLPFPASVGAARVFALYRSHTRQVTEVLDPGRRSSVKRKRFGLF